VGDMGELGGQKVRCDCVQETGWKRPLRLQTGDRSWAVEEIVDRWEEHTPGRPRWSGEHRVWQVVRLDDGGCYQLY